MRLFSTTLVLASLQLATACAEADYVAMSFAVEGSEFIASGVIDGSTLDRFEEVSQENPEISVLVLQQVDGSADDVANLAFSKKVRAGGFTTIVPSDGLVASGGTDLFLAGSERILEDGACVGVHSWSGGDEEGSDLPRNHPEHAKYLDYYREMGIDPAFYWFTLKAAAAESMHWMSATEANTYDVANVAPATLGEASICNER